MADHDWVSAHVFFHGDLDVLLTDVLVPLAGELPGEFFFLRYWDGGPHLRVRARTAAGAGRAEVRRLVGARFGDYLARNPSADRWSNATYAPLAAQLAAKERVSSPTIALEPNNSVAFLDYEPEHDRYGYGASMRAVERHFAESSRLALPVVAMGAPATRRATLALGCILTAWFVGGFDPARYASEGEPGRELELARTARRLAGQPAGGGALAYWARSLTELRTALAGDGTVPAVLNLCAHLICNRLGVSITAEAALRRRAAQAVRALPTEGI